MLFGFYQAGDTLGVIEVFNKYMRRDYVGHGDSVAPTLVTYNLVRFSDSLFGCVLGFYWLVSLKPARLVGVSFYR